MRIHLLLVFSFVLGAGASGQEKGNRVATQVADRKAQSTFARLEPFTHAEMPALREALVGAVVEDATFMMASATTLAEAHALAPEQLTLAIPAANSVIELDLIRSEIYSPGFSLVTASTDAPAVHAPGLHYRGIIAGQPNTLAAISIFPDEVMGFVSDAGGNHVLGKLEGSATEHIYYAERDLIDPPVIGCETPHAEVQPTERRFPSLGAAKTIRCVDLYWEVNHDIFQDKGGLTNTTNYITGLFNQHATLFDNDGISVLLSELYIWDVPSPYTGNTGLLGLFQEFRNSFNGDLAHLIGYGGSAGVAAGYAGLCAGELDDSMCYSVISPSYNTVPVYSWSVLVVTHEEGHLMGSRHTQACVWNGNDTAIDGCGPIEGPCGGAPIPSIGGTIMSYCHQNAVGINFNNGFGPQPAALIVDNVNAAACVNACGGVGCEMPSNVSSDPLANSATLTWSTVSGAASYTLQWSVSTTGPWLTVTGLSANSYTLLGLLSGATYLFRVRAECAGGSSAYCPIQMFTTPCTLGAACDDGIPQTENDHIEGDCVCTGTLLPGYYEQINKVVASDRAFNDLFGQSVAISGDYAIVGAPMEDHNATGGGFASMAGSAYVFVRNGDSWTQQQKIVASDRAAGDNFGICVAISGDYAIVGAHSEDDDATGGNSAPDAGSAYIFKRSGNTWTQQQKIVASDRAAADFFGISVAINGDRAIVGAYQEDQDLAGGNTLTSAGSAYIFARSDNTWAEQQKIVASDRGFADYFGRSVAISGDFAIVGANNEDPIGIGGNSVGNAGSAYVFHLSGNTWTQLQKIVAADPSLGANFGYSVAMSDDLALVGAPNEEEDEIGGNAVDDAGAAYLFRLNGSTWDQEQKIVAGDRGYTDNFGYSVAVSEDRVIVGAYIENEDAAGGNALGNSGSAYLYMRNAGAWSQLQKIVASDRADNDQFGVSVAINGRYAFVGAYQEDEDEFGNNTLNDAGSAYFFHLPQVPLNLKLWLEGPYDPDMQLMNDALRTLPSFPLLEPYTALGYTDPASGGGEATTPGVLAVSGNNAVVDWVRIELRSATDPAVIVATRHGLLQRDGDVVNATDGTSQVMLDAGPGNYYVAVRHRNHLACMRSNPMPLNLIANSINFRSSLTATYGTDARKNINGAMALWAGDCTGDGQLLYMGDGNDRDPILARIGGVEPTATTTGYFLEDVNLNGAVRYVGAGNDRDRILPNIGGIPTNTRAQQLP